ncbi:exotoxin OB-fold domain-containing protein [Staphylococcus aureus]
MLDGIFTNSSSAIDYSDLQHKSELNSKRLYNAKVSFANPTVLENKNTNDRLLKHDFLFHDMFVNVASKKVFKVEFANEALSKKFINMIIDLYAGSYSSECTGGATIKTKCIFGGDTLIVINK